LESKKRRQLHTWKEGKGGGKRRNFFDGRKKRESWGALSNGVVLRSSGDRKRKTPPAACQEEERLLHIGRKKTNSPLSGGLNNRAERGEIHYRKGRKRKVVVALKS